MNGLKDVKRVGNPNGGQIKQTEVTVPRKNDKLIYKK